jgi:hypothetical protein
VDLLRLLQSNLGWQPLGLCQHTCYDPIIAHGYCQGSAIVTVCSAKVRLCLRIILVKIEHPSDFTSPSSNGSLGGAGRIH